MKEFQATASKQHHVILARLEQTEDKYKAWIEQTLNHILAELRNRNLSVLIPTPTHLGRVLCAMKIPTLDRAIP